MKYTKTPRRSEHPYDVAAWPIIVAWCIGVYGGIAYAGLKVFGVLWAP